LALRRKFFDAVTRTPHCAAEGFLWAEQSPKIGADPVKLLIIRAIWRESQQRLIVACAESSPEQRSLRPAAPSWCDGAIDEW
jgi:hypothetical protein